MASIDKRASGAWMARWREYPGGPQRSRSFRRKVDAQEWLDEISHRIRVGSYVAPAAGRETFGAWWLRWRATRADLRESTSTRDDSYYTRHIAPTFAPVPLRAIDRKMVREWVAELVAAGLAPRTVRQAVGLVRQALEVAVEEHLIMTNPAARLRGLPQIVDREMRIATPGEVRALADHIEDRHRVWLWTMVYTGMRLGESAALRRGAVDLRRGRLVVHESSTEVRGRLVTGPPKTKAGRRAIPLPVPAIELLERQCHGLDPGDLVFTAAQGGTIRRGTFRARVWVPAAVAAGVGHRTTTRRADGTVGTRATYTGMRIHDLRHTAVSMWIAAGANMKQLTTWAGHASVATLLDRYGHLLPDHEDPVMTALAELLEPATETPGDGHADGVGQVG